jgi:hypothetical protein
MLHIQIVVTPKRGDPSLLVRCRNLTLCDRARDALDSFYHVLVYYVWAYCVFIRTQWQHVTNDFSAVRAPAAVLPCTVAYRRSAYPGLPLGRGGTFLVCGGPLALCQWMRYVERLTSSNIAVGHNRRRKGWIEIIDGEKNSGKDYRGDHGVGMEVLREDKDGISELPESNLLSSTQGSYLKAQDRTNKHRVLPVCYRITMDYVLVLYHFDRVFSHASQPIKKDCFKNRHKPEDKFSANFRPSRREKFPKTWTPDRNGTVFLIFPRYGPAAKRKIPWLRVLNAKLRLVLLTWSF